MRHVSKGSPRERLVGRPRRVVDRHDVEGLRVGDDEAEGRVPVYPGGRASTGRYETESRDHYGDEAWRHRSRVKAGSSPEHFFDTEGLSSPAPNTMLIPANPSRDMCSHARKNVVQRAVSVAMEPR